MDDRYDLHGCVDFETDSYAISVPILRRRNSNYTYIPKTDSFFIVMDFYEILELGYPVRYVDPQDERTVLIGEKAPVPILQGSEVYVVDPDWTESEVRSRLPLLSNEAVKAFLSLRSRMSTGQTPFNDAEIDVAVDDLLAVPVRSRYWISKLSALVRSSFERGTPPPKLLERLEEARLKWLDKFAAKSSLKLVQGVLDVPHLKLHPESVNRIMLRRFEEMLLSKGPFVSQSELVAYGRMFPDGIFDAIHEEAADNHEFWRRRNAISAQVAIRIFELVHAGDSTGESRLYLPSRWSIKELTGFLEFFNVVAGDDTGLDDSREYFVPLFEKCREQAALFLGDRYRLSSMVFRTQPPPPWLVRELMLALEKQPTQFPTDADDWLAVLKDVIELHRKLIVVSKIVRPHTRKQADSEIAFEEIDYALLGAVSSAVSTRNISALRTILMPSILEWR